MTTLGINDATNKFNSVNLYRFWRPIIIALMEIERGEVKKKPSLHM